MRCFIPACAIFLILFPSAWAFQTPVPVDMDSDEVWLAEADQAFEEGRLSNALDLYRKVLERVPDHIRALQMSGYILYKARHFDEARLAFEKVIQAHGDSYTPLFHLGNIHLSLSMPLKALEYYERARKLNADDAVLAGNIRMAQESIGNAKRLASRYSRSTLVLWWSGALGCFMLVLIAYIEMRALKAEQ